jgi:hypothetical protein
VFVPARSPGTAAAAATSAAAESDLEGKLKFSELKVRSLEFKVRG